MLVKYQHNEDSTPCLTEILDISYVKGDIILCPMHDSVLDVLISDVSKDEYIQIIDELYKWGKVDLTRYHKNTTYMETDNYEEL